MLKVKTMRYILGHVEFETPERYPCRHFQEVDENLGLKFIINLDILEPPKYRLGLNLSSGKSLQSKQVDKGSSLENNGEPRQDAMNNQIRKERKKSCHPIQVQRLFQDIQHHKMLQTPGRM